MKRLLTAAVGVPLVLWGIFRLPPVAFFALAATAFALAGVEYARIHATWSPAAPRWAVVPLLLWVALALVPELGGRWLHPGLAGLALSLTVGVALVVLMARTPVAEGAAALGGLAFGALYLGLPIAALAQLQRHSPWLTVLLLAIVWIGDSAAFYVGTRFGRHRLAPVLSPKKSWEGAIAALLASVVATVAWCLWRQAEVDWALLALAVVTSAAAQFGDLAESMIKRGAGVKDSGTLLPGHGGFLDRLDALAFAAPVWWLALTALDRLPAAR